MSSGGAFSSLSKRFRKGPPDEDEDLQAAKGELEKLEERWGKAAIAVSGVERARKSESLVSIVPGQRPFDSYERLLALTHSEADAGAKLVSLATVETDQSLGTALRSLGRAMEAIAGLRQGQAVSESVILNDSLGYQALNAKAAKVS